MVSYDSRFHAGGLRGEVTSLDMSVFFWTGPAFSYDIGKGLRGKCVGNNEKCICEIGDGYFPHGRVNAVDVAISDVSDFAYW